METMPETEHEVIVGWFSFPCQSDGWCVYGCGIIPAELCDACAFTGGESDLTKWHPMTDFPDSSTYEFEGVGICDRCGEVF
jgi:hypothetical protein